MKQELYFPEDQLKDIEARIGNETIRMKELQTECKNFAGCDDFNEWNRANQLLADVQKELNWLEAKKQGLQWKLDESKKNAKLLKDKHRLETLQALCDSKKALRARLDKTVTTLVHIFRDIDKLHKRKLDELRDAKGQENTAFKPETYYHHFLLVLNSRPEATVFLDMADKVQYPSVNGLRRMKDYDYDLG